MEKEPLILNLETSTEVCSVAVSRGGEVLSFRAAEESFRHSELLTTLIQQCVDECGFSLREMDAVAIASGPGSYTSLRVGTSTAKGVCYALGLPLISVDTLQALALGALETVKDSRVFYCPMIDARRMEVYCAVYNGENEMVEPPHALIVEESSFGDYFNTNRKVVFTGNGAAKCQDILLGEYAEFKPSVCSAANMSALAEKKYLNREFEDVAYYVPVYIKSPNITKSKNMSMLRKGDN